jgi:hypothetical protein
VVAEEAGDIVGSNFIYLRSLVAGISPITVDPAAQNRRIDRTLMQTVMDRNGTGEALRSPCAGSPQ